MAIRNKVNDQLWQGYCRAIRWKVRRNVYYGIKNTAANLQVGAQCKAQ